jgi:hypothetical protein
MFKLLGKIVLFLLLATIIIISQTPTVIAFADGLVQKIVALF